MAENMENAKTGPIDPCVLAECSDGDWAVERDILHAFQHGNRDDVAALRLAIVSRQPARIAAAAHRIKGASWMVGARALGQAALAIERASKEDRLAELASLLSQLEDCAREFDDWLAAQDG